nr:C-type lectin domain family 2 member D-like isoform X2 [Chrysemys picta bellii]XP_023968435.1 C-type lectin domain family 2 member D-like isoform X2 [Chrysemys picta bellii]XP_042702524.1 C-type lectin domain family 2 member D-like isoform X2 [Chrysemys picta bellii]
MVRMNKSPVLDSMSLSEREKMLNGLYPAEEMKPDPDLGSQETPLKHNRTTHVSIPPQGGESCTICPTGLLSKFKPWVACSWTVLSAVLNLILILVIALPAKKPEPCPAGAACPDSWINYLGKCYYFSQAEGNWTNSQDNCSALGASLAVIGTQQEMDFLMRHKGPSDHWIGLQKEQDQPWMWTNGTEFNNWFPIAGGGPCAFLNRGDVSSSGCSRDAHWICSKPVEKPEGRAKRL